MKNQILLTRIVFLFILLAHIIFSYYLLFAVAHGRYSYHIDNAWRALSAYKWSRSPFVTWDPVRFPLEYPIYGTVLKFWHDIPLALATVTISFSTGIIFFVFLLTHFLLKNDWAAIIASMLAAFIPRALGATIGCMSEIIMCFWVLGGIYFYLRFERSISSNPDKPSWGIQYASAVFFLLGSAQRAEGWGFVICYLALLVSLYWKNRKKAEADRPRLRKHLLAGAFISVLFIPLYIFYSYQRSGQLLRFVNHYLADFSRQGQVAPRLSVYPIYLFRLEPLLILLALSGILLLFKAKRRLLNRYLFFLVFSFALFELSALIIGAGSAPSRAVFIIAFLLCPCAAIAWEKAFSKNKLFGCALAGIILVNTGFNLPRAIKPVRGYVREEGNVDLLGSYLRKTDSFPSRKENILVELGDKWPIPGEYYLFYYVPEKLAFDKAGQWCKAWRKVLFARDFEETYLGCKEGMKWKGEESVFDRPVTELEQLFRTRNVVMVVSRSTAVTEKMKQLFRDSKVIDIYTVWSNLRTNLPEAPLPPGKTTGGSPP